MEVDSGKRFIYDKDLLHHGPSTDIGTAVSTPQVCAVSENNKRKIGIAPTSSGHQTLSTNRAENGGLDEGLSGHSGRPQKRRKGNVIYCCPYFKNSPSEHQGCAEWNSGELHRVKEHVRRAHLKPVQCSRCQIFRAGDNGQIKTHLQDGDCPRATSRIPVESDVIAKAKALEKRAMSWEQICETLFPGYVGDDIQSPYPQNCVGLPTVPTQEQGSSPIEAHTGASIDEWTNENLRDQKPTIPSVGYPRVSPFRTPTRNTFNKRTDEYLQHQMRGMDQGHGSRFGAHSGSGFERTRGYPQDQVPDTPKISHDSSPHRAHIYTEGAFDRRASGYPQNLPPRMPTMNFGSSPFGPSTRDPFDEGTSKELGSFTEYLQIHMPRMIEILYRKYLRRMGHRNQFSLSASLGGIQLSSPGPSPVPTHSHLQNQPQDPSLRQDNFHQLGSGKDHLRPDPGQSQIGTTIRNSSQEGQTTASPLEIQHPSSMLNSSPHFIAPQHDQQNEQGHSSIAQTHPLNLDRQQTTINLNRNEDTSTHFPVFPEFNGGDHDMHMDAEDAFVSVCGVNTDSRLWTAFGTN